MKSISKALTSVVILVMFVAIACAGQKSYQVTGPVSAINGSIITIKTAKDGNWDLEAGALIQKSGVKVGDKVTMQYSMTANSIVVKK